jgi:hypothetical protein
VGGLSGAEGDICDCDGSVLMVFSKELYDAASAGLPVDVPDAEYSDVVDQHVIRQSCRRPLDSEAVSGQLCLDLVFAGVAQEGDAALRVRVRFALSSAVVFLAVPVVLAFLAAGLGGAAALRAVAMFVPLTS